MAGLNFREAGPADHAALEELFRATAMGTRVRIAFERDPDYFAGSRVQADEPCVRAAFDEAGRAAGLLSAGTRNVWLEQPLRMRYLSDLRIHPDHQGTTVLARGFRLLRHEVFQPGEWAQTLVLEDNTRALKILTSGRAGLPTYQPAGRYVSWLLPQQRVSRPGDFRVRRATSSDLPEMQSLLTSSTRRRSFSPLVDLANLEKPMFRDLAIGDFLVAESRGSLAGMMGLWDQSRFQRLRITAHAPLLGMLRPLWNMFSRVKLPRPGEVVPLLKATAIACRDDDPRILRTMLSFALAESAPHLVLLGLSARDPLADAMAGLSARKEIGLHFLVGWDGTPPPWQEPFAFDAARI
jgi:hypothetical protein